MSLIEKLPDVQSYGFDALLKYDEFLLALCVWREARGEIYEGKQMIVQVIRNRAKDEKSRWPNSITRVILQPNQFSSFNYADRNSTLFPFPGDISWGDCVRAVMDEPSTLIKTCGANHYHRTDITKSWSQKYLWKTELGNHTFFKI